MALTSPLLDVVELAIKQVTGPLTLPWPMPGNPAAFITFSSFAEWRKFALQFSLREGLPEIVTAKFDRAHKLLLLTWLDFDLIKTAELSALTTLELALQDRYGSQTTKAYGNANFAHLLRYMVEHDGLTDAKVPMVDRCRGGSVTLMLSGGSKSGLAAIRNDLAHGFPFDAFPFSGLFELVRDLINYAYRDFR
jgi:hypothetical protein